MSVWFVGCVALRPVRLAGQVGGECKSTGGLTASKDGKVDENWDRVCRIMHLQRDRGTRWMGKSNKRHIHFDTIV